jgi:hypothetical protein
MTGDRERGEIAKKRLNGVAVLAMASLEASRSVEPETKRQRGALVLVLFFAAATLALLAYLGFSP